MDDQLQVAAVAPHDGVDGRGIADVDLERVELRVRLPEVRRRRRGGGLRAEEVRPHVVLEPDHVVAPLDQRADGLRTDEPSRARDYGCWHIAGITR